MKNIEIKVDFENFILGSRISQFGVWTTKICPSQVRPSAESLEAKIGEVYLRETASNQTLTRPSTRPDQVWLGGNLRTGDRTGPNQWSGLGDSEWFLADFNGF